MRTLHITNGDSTRLGLERSGIDGEYSSYDDILHEGPVPANQETARAVRVDAVSHALRIDREDAARFAARQDEVLNRSHTFDEVVFWLEHDLYDQLLLIRHLDWLAAHRHDSTRYSLVCGTVYLGPLQPDAFPPLFAGRQTISAPQIADGVRAWRAFTAPVPDGLSGLVEAGVPSLPYLAPAVRRFLEDYPWRQDGLARSERQALRAIQSGAATPSEAFWAAASMDDFIWMGDSTFWLWLRRLGSGPAPLVRLQSELADRAFARSPLTLTDAGAAVLGGERSPHLASIDRWMGGVHLTPTHLWWWDGGRPVRA